MSENENEKRETLADIVAEYRNDADAMDRGELYQPTAEYVRRLLDRIEEAWKRKKAEIEAYALAVGGIVEAERHTPGDAAAMRDAVETALTTIRGVINGTIARTNNSVFDCRDRLKAALSAPPRQCDVGTPDERMHRYHELCREISDRHERIGAHTPSFAFPTEFEWEDRPYEEGGAK